MKYLGLDYGSKRVGIAVSDEGGHIAFPRTIIPNDDALIEAVHKIATEEKTEHIIVGDTRSHGGASNPVTPELEIFIAELLARGLSVERAFEVWSSVEASRYAPSGREHDDAAAAAVILQRYLDMHKNAVP